VHNATDDMKRFEIEFRKEKAEKGKTKFGGQPDWMTRPEWPISKATGRPMRFVCQINLQDIGLDNLESRLAYLFMTDDEEYVEGTWEPDGGENAIVLQPGDNELKTEIIPNGPSLYEMIEVPGKDRLVPKNIECSVRLIQLPETDTQTHAPEIKNKFGGKPEFLQYEEYPSNDKWDLLIQLDSTAVPFSINFGDAGVGYGFISHDRKKAKFLWQCT
jgi:uncharacterized protein YwqG